MNKSCFYFIKNEYFEEFKDPYHTYLKMTKLIDNVKRGIYKITEEGIKASIDIGIDNKYLEKTEYMIDYDMGV